MKIFALIPFLILLFFEKKINTKHNSLNSTIERYKEKKYCQNLKTQFLDTATSQNQKVIITNITVKGVSEIDEEIILKILDPPLSSNLLRKRVQKILKFFYTEKKSFIQADITMLYKTKEGIGCEIRIKPAKKIIADTVFFKGLEVTRQETLLREIKIKKGKEISFQDEEISLKNLSNLEFIQNVENPKYAFSDTLSSKDTVKVNVFFKVKERQSFFFNGILGYEPRDGFFSLFGKAEVFLRNMFGSGRSLKLKWEGLEKSQEAFLFYSEPWFFNLPLHLRLDANVIFQDSLYSKFSLRLKARYDIMHRLFLSTSITWEGVNPLSLEIVPYNIFFSGLEASFDFRNRSRNPTKGGWIKLDYDLGLKSDQILYSKPTLIQRMSLNMMFYFNFFPKVVLAVGGQAKALFSENLALSDLFRFGGVNNLRGYRNNEFFIDKVIMVESEIRFLPSEATNIFLFYNGAFLTTPYIFSARLNQDEKFKQGFGLGSTFDIKVGRLKITYAIGDLYPSFEETLLKSKLHLNFIYDF